MAATLEWNQGEGYDIHVLRGGPPSRPLDQSLRTDPQFPVGQFPVVFKPHFKVLPLPQSLGVAVDAATGVVTATAPTSPSPDKLRNFLMTASQNVGGGNTIETIIRIHIHDSIDKIWLTPSTLTVHRGSHERRFTVLALFNDGVVGDITDWPQLTYTSSVVSAATVVNVGDSDPLSAQPVTTGGVITVEAPGGSSVITVNLSLGSQTLFSASARVFTKSFWSEDGANAKVKFISGPVAPDPNEVDPDSKSSIESVVGNAVNILFLAEGFSSGQKRDFDKMVRTIVRELRGKKYLLPFSLLRDSINYWSVYVPSQEEAVSILGDQQIEVVAFPVPLPRKPASNAAEWTVANMIHEGGLPTRLDASAQDPAAWVASRLKFFDMPINAPVNPRITKESVDAWNALKSRSLLNERDTAFGLAHYDRPRASGQDQSEWRLLLDARRTSEDSFRMFIENLRFAKSAAGSTPFDIGQTWRSGASLEGKDVGLVCVVCRDDTRGGTWMPAGRTAPYFAASAGQTELAIVTAAASGTDIRVPAPVIFSAPTLASRCARGCGLALGLGDEYGDDGAILSVARSVAMEPNLQPETADIVTGPLGTAPRVIDATKIKWLWPRIVKSAVLDVRFDSNGNLQSPEKCDSNGAPNPNGSHLLVRLHKSQLFFKDDDVRIRASVNWNRRPAWLLPSEDTFAAFPLVVEQDMNDDTVILRYAAVSPSQLGYLAPTGTQLDLGNFSPQIQYSLISPRFESGDESRLVPESIRVHIDSSDSPLNAARGLQGAACVPGSAPFQRVTPTNLPQGTKPPRHPLTDIIGIYDGGGRVDCGVFRPTGRCRMRDVFATVPFCHVCCYILVDMIDPSMHEELDKFYPEVKP